MPLNSATILKIPFSGSRREEVLEKILAFEADLWPKKPLIIFTPNPEFLVEASKNLEFKEILQRSEINLPDGVGLILAAKVLGKQIGSRFSGADLTEELLTVANEKKWTIGIVAARRGVRSETSELIKRLQIKYPNTTFVNLDDPNYQFLISNFKTNPNDQNSKFNIQYSKFNVIFACQGMVKQETWIMNNKDRIKARVFIGVGGSLDFITGFTRRAPGIMRVIGLEWLWRGLQHPRHFKRIWKAVFEFGLLVLKEKFS